MILREIALPEEVAVWGECVEECWKLIMQSVATILGCNVTM